MSEQNPTGNVVLVLSQQEASAARDIFSRLSHSGLNGVGAPLPPQAELKAVASLISTIRRGRSFVFDEKLFADPAWDMLITLYCADGDQALSVTSLTYAADVPPTTGLRWIQNLEHCGLVERHAHGTDRRRITVRLTREGQSKIERCLKRGVEKHSPIARVS